MSGYYKLSYWEEQLPGTLEIPNAFAPNTDVLQPKHVVVTEDRPTCPKCGSPIGPFGHEPPDEYELEQWGSIFDDIIADSPGFLVSQRFKDCWLNSDCMGIDLFMPVTILKVKGPKRNIKPVPNYYRIEGKLDGAMLDYKRSGSYYIKMTDSSPTKPTCDLCGGFAPPYYDRIVLQEGTVQNNDIFRLYNKNQITLITQKAKDLIEDNRLASCRIMPIEMCVSNPGFIYKDYHHYIVE